MTGEFGVLGVVEARIAGRPVELGHARQRCVLAVLLVEAGRPVSMDRLVDRVWDTGPPQRAAGAIYSYLSRIRRALAGAPGVGIERRPGGYVLTAGEDTVDLHTFRRLTAQARAAGPDRTAADLYTRALGLWRGEAFAGLDTPWLAATRRLLADERLAAELDRHDVLLRLGRHRELVPVLSAAADGHPLDERLAEQLMLALHRSGRSADAGEHYRRIRRHLADELGVDPGARLRRLHERILTGDPGLGAGTPRAEPRPRGAAAPAHLPADVRAFTGRRPELATLDRALPSPDGTEPPLTVVLLSGTAGVGKSALAIRWAHRVRASFPDGQLYVNLRGYDTDQPMTADDALAGLLTALGVRGPEIPSGADERAGRYRSELTGRRVLVVLDNASSVEQVRPLLPGTGSCLVLITSRDSLPAMVAVHGAERITLDLLPEPDAIGLLRRLIGDRVDRDPAAARRLASAGARLPLALRIAAELAAAHPEVPLADLVADLGDHRNRLDLLDAGDPRAEIRAVFSWSYQHLPADAARLFRLLGLHPGDDLAVDAVAALAGTTTADVRRRLGVLTRASLVQAGRGGRYGLHDLLRAYAAELAGEHDPAPDRDEAVTRLLDHFLARSATAMRVLYDLEPGDAQAARDWLEAERTTLLAAGQYAYAYGRHRFAVTLAETLFRHLDAGGPVAEAVTFTSTAVSAARAIGDRPAQARAQADLGRLYRRQGRLHEARDAYRRALEVYAALGDRCAEAVVSGKLGSVHWRLGDYRQAAENFERAHAHHRELGDEPGQADFAVRLALVDARLGRHAEATGRLRGALDRLTRLGDEFSEAYVLSLLARLSRRPAELDRAAGRLTDSLASVRRAGNRTAEAYVLTDLAAVHAHSGRLPDAAEHLQQALLLHRRIGDRASEAEARNDLGQVLLTAGDLTRARTEHERALVLAREIGDRYEQARAHHGMAAAVDGTAARPHRESAEHLFTDLGTPAAPGLAA